MLNFLFRRKEEPSFEVSLSPTRIPADGRSSAEVVVRPRPGHESPERLTFSLSQGSFSPDEVVREQTLTADPEGVFRFRVYAPRRPAVITIAAAGRPIAELTARASLIQSLIYEWVPMIAIAIVLAFILRTYAVAAYYIPSGSMEPTLQVRDRLIAVKFPYVVLKEKPKFGDIVIFKPDWSRKDFIKRVIGLPGDTIQVVKGVGVFRNGKLLEEPYVKSPPNYNWGPEVVPEGKYFVLGDNRANSWDSHYWGFLEQDDIEGQAVLVFWPPRRFSLLTRSRPREIDLAKSP